MARVIFSLTRYDRRVIIARGLVLFFANADTFSITRTRDVLILYHSQLFAFCMKAVCILATSGTMRDSISCSDSRVSISRAS